MSTDNPSWGEDKISAELEIKFGIKHSTRTILEYMVKRAPSRGQTWKSCLENHAHAIFVCDFMTQHTALFAMIYTFIVMELSTRRIVHVDVTAHPSLAWVKRQILDLCAFDRAPRFLVHDNNNIFGQCGHPRKGSRDRLYRCHLDLWLAKVLKIKGLPTPYRAPNANAHVERFHRTLREEALNHFIFLRADHVRGVVQEWVSFYNGTRPSQATTTLVQGVCGWRAGPRQASGSSKVEHEGRFSLTQGCILGRPGSDAGGLHGADLGDLLSRQRLVDVEQNRDPALGLGDTEDELR